MPEFAVKHAQPVLDAPPILNDDKMSARFCISSEREDLEGDILLTKGGDFTDYRRNPVCLLEHNATALVGKSESPDGLSTVEVRPDKGKIYATCYFAKNQLGEQCFELVRDKFLRGASVGFISTKAQARGKPRTKNGKPPLLISNWRVHEWSLTVLPMNPDAVREQMERQFGGKALDAVLVKALEPYAAELKAWSYGWAPKYSDVKPYTELAESMPLISEEQFKAAEQLIANLERRSQPMHTIQSMAFKADSFKDWAEMKSYAATYGYAVGDAPTVTDDAGSRFDFLPESDGVIEVAIGEKAIGKFVLAKSVADPPPWTPEPGNTVKAPTLDDLKVIVAESIAPVTARIDAVEKAQKPAQEPVVMPVVVKTAPTPEEKKLTELQTTLAGAAAKRTQLVDTASKLADRLQGKN